MRCLKSFLFGASALAISAGGAIAEPLMNPEDSSASAIYEVDDDRDGRADRMLILEHSDSLA